MGLFSRILARIYPPLFLPVLPMRTTDFLGNADFVKSSQEETAQYLSMTGRCDGDRVEIFVADEQVGGIRFDLELSEDALKIILNRSALKWRRKLPTIELEVPGTYVASLDENRVTISGYTGSIGIWTKDMRERIKKKER